MKKAMIFDAYDDYNIRIRYIKNALERNGYSVSIFFADFDHVKKQRYEVFREDVNYIPAEPYRKNLSYARIHSHMEFSKSCIQILEKENDIDLVYVMVPPNSMVKEFALYKQKHPHVKLWYDVLDMWPESLPVSNMFKKAGAPVWNIWRDMRDRYLKYADVVTTECDLFQDPLKDKAFDMKTIYLCQPEHFVSSTDTIDECIHFLYCGSINHIIDIDLIVTFLNKVKRFKKVSIDIIGEGESKETFLQRLKEHEIPYADHGIVYDEDVKRGIYQKCHFGINVMKDTVYVGLTMKSLDYMSHGLPLINTIKADTWRMTEKKRIGFNISKDTIDPVVNQLCALTDTDYQNIRKNTEDLFQECFSEIVIDQKLDQFLKTI